MWDVNQSLQKLFIRNHITVAEADVDKLSQRDETCITWTPHNSIDTRITWPIKSAAFQLPNPVNRSRGRHDCDFSRRTRTHFPVRHTSRNGAGTQMEYVSCANGVERWEWGFWVGSPPGHFQSSVYRPNLRRPPVRTTASFSKYKNKCANPVQCARMGTLSQEARNSRWEGS